MCQFNVSQAADSNSTTTTKGLITNIKTINYVQSILNTTYKAFPTCLNGQFNINPWMSYLKVTGPKMYKKMMMHDI